MRNKHLSTVKIEKNEHLRIEFELPHPGREFADFIREYGEVSSANIITDRETGRSRGFGFVEMPDESAARNAINALNGFELDERAINVNEARPKTERSDRGGYGSNQGGGYGRNRY